MVRMLCAAVSVLVVCLSAARADEKKADPEIAILKARLEAQTTALQALRKWADEAEHERVQLILAKEAALREARQAENEAKLARAIADEYQKKIEDLTAQLREMKKLTAGGAEAPRPRDKGAPAADLRGTVTRDIVGDYVLINLGIDAGVEPGTVLEVIRVAGKDAILLGTLTITKSVYPKEAVGTFTPARQVPVAKLRPEELPRKGDTVRSPTPAPGK
jgi:hypothetical protein